MAYSTGSGGSSTELLDAIQVFASAQGWTISSYLRGSYLKMSNGVAKIMIVPTSVSRDIYSGNSITGSRRSAPDAGLDGRLCSSFTSDIRIDHQTNSSNVDVVIYDLTGPLVQWYLFAGNAGAGDPPYIHCVVQTAGDRYTHMSMGLVDKKNLTHGGAAYLVGHGDAWYQNNYTDYSPSFNFPQFKTVPFGNSCGNIYVPDALPLTGGWTTMNDGFNPTMYTYDNPLAPFTLGVTCRLNSCVSMSSPSTYAGFSVLWAMPVILRNAAGSLCYVGDFPNVRACNMETLTASQEINLGSDVWKVFPVQRQSNWSSVGVDPSPSTGQYGLAYKKV